MTNLETQVALHLVPVVLEEECTKEIPPGLTPVPRLKAELGIEPSVTLWLIDRSGHKRPLDDDDVVDVRAGERFEAICGGGVS
jgi:hypothetical protein